MLITCTILLSLSVALIDNPADNPADDAFDKLRKETQAQIEESRLFPAPGQNAFKNPAEDRLLGKTLPAIRQSPFTDDAFRKWHEQANKEAKQREEEAEYLRNKQHTSKALEGLSFIEKAVWIVAGLISILAAIVSLAVMVKKLIKN